MLRPPTLLHHHLKSQLRLASCVLRWLLEFTTLFASFFGFFIAGCICDYSVKNVKPVQTFSQINLRIFSGVRPYARTVRGLLSCCVKIVNLHGVPHDTSMGSPSQIELGDMVGGKLLLQHLQLRKDRRLLGNAPRRAHWNDFEKAGFVLWSALKRWVRTECIEENAEKGKCFVLVQTMI